MINKEDAILLLERLATIAHDRGTDEKLKERYDACDTLIQLIYDTIADDEIVLY
jgi:hypothetical protein